MTEKGVEGVPVRPGQSNRRLRLYGWDRQATMGFEVELYEVEGDIGGKDSPDLRPLRCAVGGKP